MLMHLRWENRHRFLFVINWSFFCSKTGSSLKVKFLALKLFSLSLAVVASYNFLRSVRSRKLVNLISLQATSYPDWSKRQKFIFRFFSQGHFSKTVNMRVLFRRCDSIFLEWFG